VKRAIVFDGDDTLWHTERLYDEARDEARRVVENAGLDGARWEAIEREVDVRNVERFGHSTERFPTSCVEAYDALCEVLGMPVDPTIRTAVGDAARAVFARTAPLVDHAHETLTALRARGYRLALLTKGDPDTQRRRIDDSGLAPLFDAVEIVDQKTPAAIGALVTRLGVEPGAVLSVGNSVRSDILPSLAAGVQPVWIDAHVWEYERDHGGLPDEQVIAIDDLSGLLEVVS
jgi:putative hydrolase of the HAD superfamily